MENGAIKSGGVYEHGSKGRGENGEVSNSAVRTAGAKNEEKEVSK